MNQDLGKIFYSITSISENICALKKKIKKGEDEPEVYGKKVEVWKKELAKAEMALERRRRMA